MSVLFFQDCVDARKGPECKPPTLVFLHTNLVIGSLVINYQLPYLLHHCPDMDMTEETVPCFQSGLGGCGGGQTCDGVWRINSASPPGNPPSFI